MTTPDRLERDITISAPIARVWAVLTEPQHISAWFGPGTPDPPDTEIDLRPGGVMVLNHGQYGTYPTRIEAVEPPHYFAYRWASGYIGVPATDENSTLVEFRLTEVNSTTTTVVVTESGFATLTIPPGREEHAGYDSHVEGWTEIVAALGARAEES